MALREAALGVRRPAALGLTAPAAVLLGAGLLLRLSNLTYHSFWLDEAVSVLLARFSPTELVAYSLGQQEANPPLYFLLLGLWMGLVGDGDLAVRLLSVLASGAGLVGLYALSRALLPRSGAPTLLLAALSPYLVWYAQEARMYALLFALAAWGSLALLRAIEDDRPLGWLAFAALALAALYTHLFAAFLLPGWALTYLLALRARRAGLRGAVALAAVGALYLPWAWTVWQASGTAPSWRPDLGWQDFTLRLAPLFTAFQSPLGRTANLIATLPSRVLVLLGIAHGARRWPGWRASLLPLELIGVPLLAFVLSSRVTLYSPPYFIVAAPSFFLLAGLGAAWLADRSRTLAGALLGLAVLPLVLSLGTLWSGRTAKEDWRAAARYLGALTAPGDVIVAYPDYVAIPLARYYRGQAPIHRPWGAPPPGGGALDELLEPAQEGARNVWLVQSHQQQLDPEGRIRTWFAQRLPLVSEAYPTGIAIQGFAADLQPEMLPDSARLHGQEVTPGLRLAAVSLWPAETQATDALYHPPSAWVHVTLFWKVTAGSRAPLVSEIRMVDAAGGVWGLELERAESVWHRFPSVRWPAGGYVRTEHDVNLNPATPPGTYRLELRLERLDGEPVPGALEAVELGTVQILP